MASSVTAAIAAGSLVPSSAGSPLDTMATGQVIALMSNIQAPGLTSDFTQTSASTGWMSFQVELPFQKATASAGGNGTSNGTDTAAPTNAARRRKLIGDTLQGLIPPPGVHEIFTIGSAQFGTHYVRHEHHEHPSRSRRRLQQEGSATVVFDATNDVNDVSNKANKIKQAAANK